MLPGITEVPETFFSMHPSLPVAFQFDFSILEKPNFYVIMFTFLFTGFFDTAGTLWESFQELISMIRKEDFREQSRHLMADAMATCAGAVMRTSKVTTYVESASGVEAGGRKGLTSVVVAAFFLLAIFISPIASVIRGMQHLRLL